MRINTVTIERKKFSEVYGVFRALYSSSRLFYAQIMYSRWKTQTGGSSSKETGLKSVDSTYCVPTNILMFTGFSSTAL